MPRHKFFTGTLVALGSLAGSLAYRRRTARHRERVDLYAPDGAMASVVVGPDADRLLTLARELVHQAE